LSVIYAIQIYTTNLHKQFCRHSDDEVRDARFTAVCWSIIT